MEGLEGLEGLVVDCWEINKIKIEIEKEKIYMGEK